MWRSVTVLAALAAVLGAALSLASPARANQLVTITLPDRHGEIPSKWLTYSGQPRADVLLPDDYSIRKRYPLIVLLPGFGNTYAILGPGMLDAQKVLAGLQAIVVSPEGEEGWYADWYNNDAYGTPKWESYILDEAIPQIVKRYSILPQRRYHALFGISMGGLGAAYLGGRLPGFFGSVGALSGFVDLQIAPGIVTPAMDTLSGVPSGSVVGPENGFYTTGHNPTALVHNLQYTRVFVSAGNGVNTPADGTGAGPGNAEEAGVIRPMSDAYDSALKAAGINVTYQTHNGCHCWPDFQDELRNVILWGPFKAVVEHPQNWVNQTVARHGQLWDIGYQFAKHPAAVVRFTRTGNHLSISAASSAVMITTSNGCVLHVATPASVTLPKSCSSKRTPAPGAKPFNCASPTGKLQGQTLGPVRLGMTRTQTRRRFTKVTLRGRRYMDFFCRTRGVIRVGYATPKLLQALSAAMRRRVRGRAVVILTANHHYALDGVRPSTKLAAVAGRLRLSRPFQVGRNRWYLLNTRNSRGVFKVQRGRVLEIGTTERSLTATRADSRRFLRTFY
jgi:esterase/lipase superfamily enzyme